MSHEAPQSNVQTIPPDENVPVAVPQGWDKVGGDWVVDTDILDDPLTPEEIAEQERVKARRELAEQLLTPYYDERVIATAYVPWYISRQTNDRQEQIQSIGARHKEQVRDLAVRIATSGWDDSELPTLANGVIDIADTLNPDDRNPQIMTNLVRSLETPEDIELTKEFAGKWHDRVMQGATTDEQFNRATHFERVTTELSGVNTTPRPVLDTEVKKQIFDGVLETHALTYAYEEKFPYDRNASKVADTARAVILYNARCTKDAEQAAHLNTVLKAAMQEEPVLGERFLELSRSYGRNHPLDEQTTNALISNVLPRMRAQDPSIKPILHAGNSYGMREGDFGIADFYAHSLTREATPGNINELLVALREIPASTQERLEQNRQDALRLVSTFGILRDFIHDERPGVHDVISGMVKFATTGDATSLNAAMDKADYFNNAPDNRKRMNDPANYDKQIKPGYGKPEEPVLAILERLEKNTRPVDEEPPEVTDETLAGMLADAYAAGPQGKKEAVTSVTRYLNDQMTAMMREHVVGIEPSMVTAIAWIDRQQFKVLQGLTYEDQIRLPRQEWFKDTLKFHELTHNEDYDAEEFEQFLGNLKGMNDSTAFRAIAGRVLNQTQCLAEKYRGRGKDHWTEALWTGNTTHELVGLTDPRKAATAVGRRLLVNAMR